jgi:hypothetical protein
MEAACFQQTLRDDRRAAGRVKIGRDKPSGWLQIGDERH